MLKIQDFLHFRNYQNYATIAPSKLFLHVFLFFFAKQNQKCIITYIFTSFLHLAVKKHIITYIFPSFPLLAVKNLLNIKGQRLGISFLTTYVVNHIKILSPISRKSWLLTIKNWTVSFIWCNKQPGYFVEL